MSGTLLFVHGTGARDVSEAIAVIRDRVEHILGWPAASVVNVPWGTDVGPADLPITDALPPEYTDRAAGGAAAVDEEVALWSLLLAEPLVEVELLGTAPAAAQRIAPGEDVPAVAFVETLRNAAPPDDALRAAGLDTQAFAAAREKVANDPGTSGAAAAAADPLADDELVAAVARAVVATMLAAHRTPPPLAAYDADARDALVEAVARAVSPAVARGGALSGLAKRILTKVAVAHRRTFTEPASDFVRDIAYYLAHGPKVRDYIAAAVREHEGRKPVVLLGHSLGGIACVDLLSLDPTVPADLLVTAGSQSPMLYLMGALQALRPTTPPTGKPFTPWLNAYNREDLMSFCAERVFPHADVWDVAVDARVPFPDSHSAYWAQDVLYESIAKHLP